MTHALAMFVGAITLRGWKEPRRHACRGDDDLGLMRAGFVPRRPMPGDPAMIEDDYFRFRNAPRD